jgi:hypothetical protein
MHMNGCIHVHTAQPPPLSPAHFISWRLLSPSACSAILCIAPPGHCIHLSNLSNRPTAILNDNAIS